MNVVNLHWYWNLNIHVNILTTQLSISRLFVDYLSLENRLFSNVDHFVVLAADGNNV